MPRNVGKDVSFGLALYRKVGVATDASKSAALLAGKLCHEYLQFWSLLVFAVSACTLIESALYSKSWAALGTLLPCLDCGSLVIGMYSC